MMSLAEALLWLVYGAMIADAALLAGGTTGVVMATAILLRLAAVGSVSNIIRMNRNTRVKVAQN